MGLEPACVVVCPEHAIISGDMDDPLAEISQMLAAYDVTVRKPEQGTSPKLFYVDGDEAALHPTATDRNPDSFAWAEVQPLYSGTHRAAKDDSKVSRAKTSASGESIRKPSPQGSPEASPIHIGGGRMADEMVRTFYNAQHKVPWHWPVPAYLVTKGIGAGVFLILALGSLLGITSYDPPTFLAGGFLTLFFIGITTGLLVYDLERPERFLTILTRPQWASWLTKGAFLLVGFTLLIGAWWILELGSESGWWASDFAETVRTPVLWVGSVLAIGVAVYTAFLFGQAEGRDLWQSPLLPIHLLVQAFLAGSATLLIADPVLGLPSDVVALAELTFAVSLILDLLMIFLGEFGMPHASSDAARAAHQITKGRYAREFWLGAITIGHAIPLVLWAVYGFTVGVMGVVAGLLAIIGLFVFERAFVMAPQEIPNS